MANNSKEQVIFSVLEHLGDEGVKEMKCNKASPKPYHRKDGPKQPHSNDFIGPINLCELKLGVELQPDPAKASNSDLSSQLNRKPLHRVNSMKMKKRAEPELSVLVPERRRLVPRFVL
ncbi:hypothetical protein MTR_7g056770 [Medicago truncatula]|uniref:Uncharacterized protein n=1 Tax=Medicago truncatula TaxID=3880 RepID=A0A072TZ42_MEDTR|nr:hypothetical protein MTR_7g056770 [Medicago truncatula]